MTECAERFYGFISLEVVPHAWVIAVPLELDPGGEFYRFCALRTWGSRRLGGSSGAQGRSVSEAPREEGLRWSWG